MNYTRYFALVPKRMESQVLVWLSYYYMRPNSNGEGIYLSEAEYWTELELRIVQQE